MPDLRLIPLGVPPWDEKRAFALDVEWSKRRGFYITNRHFLDDFLEWIPQKWNPLFPKPVLVPDMLPVTTWENNVRTRVSASRWDELRRYCYAAAGFRCGICAAQGPLECHEEWRFDDASGVQRLTGLAALCPMCHKAKHVGRARALGKLDAVIEHIAYVDDLSEEEVFVALREAETLWRKRSLREWTLDLDWLDRYRIPRQTG